ncbi:sulfotransferase [Halomonas sp. OfavH-34-E]|uniref:sulfotransferase n=1 Tax=Halomonas sp. OfavH-34-E TaxID=2954491 RepID=UPI0020979972|nr:sulfotransferase [Halomonas sp. OfavH-34-E]MCO7214899.1 sulfotransferase [Halomonas sp. OfavH-34-E]
MEKIFIVGRHRSGTTMVSNLLVENGIAYSPVHEEHKGVHESAFFSHVVPYFNGFKSNEDRLTLHYSFQKSDYFRLLGIGAKKLPHSENKYQYFCTIMSQAAEKNGYIAWLEKTPAHSLFVRELYENIEGVKIVWVKRNLYDVIKSNVYAFGCPSKIRFWFKHAVISGCYDRILYSFREKMYCVSYEKFVANPKLELSLLSDHLVGGRQVTIEKSGYSKNSSYGKLKRGESDKLRDKIYFNISRVLYFLIFYTPANVIVFAIHCRMKLRTKLPSWFYKVYS